MTFHKVLHIIFACFLSVTFMFAQEQKGYRIDGDDVVFTFKRSDYELLSHDHAGYRISFDDLSIDNVVVAGEFNNWSKFDWKMTKVDEDTYELRKPLSKFGGEYSWQFKFLINNEYWAEPSERDPNIVNAKNIHGDDLYVYNLKMFAKAYPDDNGNVRFRLRGYKNAKEVIVSGSFNKWNESALKMYRIDNGWEIKVQIDAGDYEYRYIVDGHWMEDPTNPDKVRNEFNEFNSRLNVGKYVTFLLKGHQDADQVILSGSFNDWNETDRAMTKTDNGYWNLRLPLPAGKHHYKFIVDGEWILDPENPIKEYDGKGHVNSVYMVR